MSFLCSPLRHSFDFKDHKVEKVGRTFWDASFLLEQMNIALNAFYSAISPNFARFNLNSFLFGFIDTTT